MSTKSEKSLLKYASLAESNNKIPSELHLKYNTKRGLRRSNGSGVLVGLTEIGDVHGYVMDEGEKVPDAGRLLYRGISVADFVNNFQAENRFGFEEVCCLLLFGELPNQDMLDSINTFIGEKRILPDHFVEDMILKTPSKDLMNKLARSVLSLYSSDEDPEDLSINNVLRQCFELIARIPVLSAYGFQARCHYFDNESLVIHRPQPDLSTAENFLYMIRTDNKYSQLEAHVLDLCLVLHAEHGGGNNSSFTVHVVSSSDTDTYSAIAAAIGSLKGGKHGGANIKVSHMMQDLKAQVKDTTNVDQLKDYFANLLSKQAFDKSGLIYGFGHAVYTISDPRAVLLKAKAKELAYSLGREDEFELYSTIESLVPEVFQDIKQTDQPIAPNVDFYSGLVYDMLGIPQELYTPLFAIARMAGWAAHRVEELVSGGKIIRPAYKSIVHRRPYLPMTERE